MCIAIKLIKKKKLFSKFLQKKIFLIFKKIINNFLFFKNGKFMTQ